MVGVSENGQDSAGFCDELDAHVDECQRAKHGLYWPIGAFDERRDFCSWTQTPRIVDGHIALKFDEVDVDDFRDLVTFLHKLPSLFMHFDESSREWCYDFEFVKRFFRDLGFSF